MVSQVLLKLKKFDDLNTFLERVYDVVTSLIDDSQNERVERNFEP